MLAQLDAGSVVLSAVKGDVGTRSHRSRPTTAVMTETKVKADALILQDGRPQHKRTVHRNTDWKTGGYGRHQRTGLQQFCAMRVPKMFTVEHKTARKSLCRTAAAQ